MQEYSYEEIQEQIVRPRRLCLCCGRCMPIIDGENMQSSQIDKDAIRGPISVWDEYPIECGFTGWLFIEREKQKHLVRKMKEELHAISFLEDDMLVSKDTTVGQRKYELKTAIEKWFPHGAINW